MRRARTRTLESGPGGTPAQSAGAAGAPGGVPPCWGLSLCRSLLRVSLAGADARTLAAARCWASPRGCSRIGGALRPGGVSLPPPEGRAAGLPSRLSARPPGVQAQASAVLGVQWGLAGGGTSCLHPGSRFLRQISTLTHTHTFFLCVIDTLRPANAHIALHRGVCGGTRPILP